MKKRGNLKSRSFTRKVQNYFYIIKLFAFYDSYQNFAIKFQKGSSSPNIKREPRTWHIARRYVRESSPEIKKKKKQHNNNP